MVSSDTKGRHQDMSLEKRDIIPLIFLAELIIISVLWYILDNSNQDVLGYQAIMGIILAVSFELWLAQDKVTNIVRKIISKNNYESQEFNIKRFSRG
jgi:hypothetical protein